VNCAVATALSELLGQCMALEELCCAWIPAELIHLACKVMCVCVRELLGRYRAWEELHSQVTFVPCKRPCK
jgi:hypothetical protein